MNRFLLICWWTLSLSCLGGEVRVFTSKDGRTLKGSIESATEKTVTVKRDDGRSVTLGLDQLTPDDVIAVKGWLILKIDPDALLALPGGSSRKWDIKGAKQIEGMPVAASPTRMFIETSDGRIHDVLHSNLGKDQRTALGWYELLKKEKAKAAAGGAGS